MLKCLLLGAVLWLQIVCNAASPTTSVPSIVPTTPTPGISDIHRLLTDPNSVQNLHLAQQMFYLNGPLAWSNHAALMKNPNPVGKEVGTDYLVTTGIGAHKLHVRKLPWNRARRICQEEGGHLAIVRSVSEEKIILQLMHDDSVEDAWIGYHDLFEEGDWISVLDEPLGQTGWARWSKNFTPNPDNLNGNQHCARIVKTGGGMDDDGCEVAKPFVCKITNL